MQFGLKVVELVGCQCHAIGVKIGRAIHFLMVKFSPLKSQQVMAALFSATMLSLLAGHLVKLTLASNSIEAIGVDGKSLF